jgi:hypothetical protein
VIGPQPVPFAIALLVEVPWQMANKQQTVRLALIDLDGHSVTPIGADKPETIELTFELGRPPGLRAGSMLPLPVAINHGPMPLPPGGHYEWRLTVNGEARDDWRLAFSTRPAAQAQAA